MDAAPETTCRQVNAKEGVGLRRWPCHDDAYVPPGDGGNNTIITYLTRGQSVAYNNTDSKQTSVCGKLPDPGVKALCWIAVKTATGVEGFIPAARGEFADAFCSPAPSTDTESLVIQPCGGSCLLQVQLVKLSLPAKACYEFMAAGSVQHMVCGKSRLFNLLPAVCLQSLHVTLGSPNGQAFTARCTTPS